MFFFSHLLSSSFFPMLSPLCDLRRHGQLEEHALEALTSEVDALRVLLRTSVRVSSMGLQAGMWSARAPVMAATHVEGGGG